MAVFFLLRNLAWQVLFIPSFREEAITDPLSTSLHLIFSSELLYCMLLKRHRLNTLPYRVHDSAQVTAG